jgi:N-acetylglutamate synthase-like GNAT family acetyltransferase
LIEKYRIECISIFNFYLYHIREQKNHPVQVIEKFIEIYEKKVNTKIRAPEFVLDFFKELKSEFKKIKSKDELINRFAEYKNKKIFLERLDEFLSDTINKFLGYEEEYLFE